MAVAEGVVIPTEEKKVEWRGGHEKQLLRWASALRHVLLVDYLQSCHSTTSTKDFKLINSLSLDKFDCIRN